MFNVLVSPTPSNYKIFSSKLAEAKKANPKGHYVSYFRPEQLDAMKCKLMLSCDGKAGFAVTKDNEIIALFKHPESKITNMISKALPLAKLYGAKRLECFEGFLSNEYKKHGFQIAETYEWDDSQAPNDWSYELSGRPNYLLMRL